MSLDFYYDYVADKSLIVNDKGDFTPLCQVACFTLMAIGVQSVSEKNLDDIVARCRVLDALGQTLLMDNASLTQRNLNRDEWKSLIELRTNVSREPFSRWLSRKAKSNKVKVNDLLVSALSR